MGSELLVSCLCVTENRPEFMPWLLWCYDRQTWDKKELVIVDSSVEPLAVSRPDVRVVHAPAGSGIMQKRSIAFREMRGDALAWFDDDDWQHPERIESIAMALRAGAEMAGVGHTWLLDLFEGTCRRHVEPKGALLFNATGYTRELAQSAESMLAQEGVGMETVWSYGLQSRAGSRAVQLGGPPLTALLCHGANVANVPSRWHLDAPLEGFRTEAGERAWRGTGEQLEALRDRLRGAAVERRSQAVHTRADAGPARRRERPRAWRRHVGRIK